MDPLRLPHWNSPEVKQTAGRLSSLATADTPLAAFLRQYFGDNLTRIAMNLVLLRGLIRPGDNYLDVGSLGIEPLIIKHESPSCTVKALSYEGNRIGIGPQGFCELNQDDDARSIRIEQIDVERQRFPYEDNSFDLVSCFEVLEHLKFTPIPMLKEIKRVLKPAGNLILTTPNINSARSTVKMLCGWPPQECPYYHDLPGYGVVHPKEYTTAEVEDLLTSLGFELELLETVNTRRQGWKARLASLLALLLTIPFRYLANTGKSGAALGENILIKARKGGPIVSEFPASLFRTRSLGNSLDN